MPSCEALLLSFTNPNLSNSVTPRPSHTPRRVDARERQGRTRRYLRNTRVCRRRSVVPLNAESHDFSLTSHPPYIGVTTRKRRRLAASHPENKSRHSQTASGHRGETRSNARAALTKPTKQATDPTGRRIGREQLSQRTYVPGNPRLTLKHGGAGAVDSTAPIRWDHRIRSVEPTAERQVAHPRHSAIRISAS